MSILGSLKKVGFLTYLNDKVKEIYFKYCISNEKNIKRKFKQRQGRELNLNNPVYFTDKLQWLKLYWHDPIATSYADKYEARKLVERKVGGEYLNKIIGVYDSVDDIDLDKLPEKFVLKGTHGSGYNIICKDKNSMEWSYEFKKMKRWLWNNYHWSKGEWVYKDIKPRIICEEFLQEDNLSSSSLADYKFYCFNGVPHFCQVIRGRDSFETIDFFDMNWRHMPFTGMRLLPNSRMKIEKPKSFDEMIRLARRLSQRFPFVRVDFYYVNGKIYFGELTFFPTSGMGEFDPPKWNRTLGDLLTLPKTL